MEAPKKTINGQNPPNPAQRRSCPRYPFSPAVEAIDDQASIRIRGRLSDISRNGCYMDTISPFAPKSVVSLVITKDNQLFKTQAKVIYSQIGMGMGLLFTTADPDQLLLLGTWLACLCHPPTGGRRARQASGLPLFDQMKFFDDRQHHGARSNCATGCNSSIRLMVTGPVPLSPACACAGFP